MSLWARILAEIDKRIARAFRERGFVSDRLDAGTIGGQVPGTALPWPPSGYPRDVAAEAADGTATSPARSDHVHAHGSIAASTDPEPHPGYQKDGELTVHHVTEHTATGGNEGDVLTVQADGSLALQAPTGGGGGSITVEEIDGTPSVADVSTIRVTNGTLTDEGDGTVRLDFGAAAYDGSAIHDNEAGEIAAIAKKASPVAADLLLIEDSEAGNAKKRITLGSLAGVLGLVFAPGLLPLEAGLALSAILAPV